MPEPTRFAHFPPDQSPGFGVCLSSFVVLRKGGRVLLATMAPHEAWSTMDQVRPRPETFSGSKWVLPAAHLLVGEAPETAALRVLRQQLDVRRARLKSLKITSEFYENPVDSSGLHWDVCFLYEGEALDTPTKHAWFGAVEYRDTSAMRKGDFARGHGDIVEAAGLPLRVV